MEYKCPECGFDGEPRLESGLCGRGVGINRARCDDCGHVGDPPDFDPNHVPDPKPYFG